MNSHFPCVDAAADSVRSRINRRGAVQLVLAAIAGLAIPCGDAFAQGKAAEKKVVEEKTLDCLDGFPIRITYYKSKLGKDAPAVILLHQERSSRLEWKANGIADKLQDEGYAVVTVDLRHHGESQPAGASTTGSGKKGSTLGRNEYMAMVEQDLEAVKSFLVEEHEKKNLNIRKLGIVAAGMSGPIAISYAALDWLRKPYDDAPTLDSKTPRGQDVRLLILLSPDENVAGVPTVKPLTVLNNPPQITRLCNPSLELAAFIAYGDKDKQDHGDARKIHDKLMANDFNDKKKDRILLKKFETNARGAEMLDPKQKLGLEANILGVLKAYLMDLPDEWKTRKSRLTS